MVVYIITSSFRQLSSQFVRARDMTKASFALDGILATGTLFIFNVLFISVLHWGCAASCWRLFCRIFFQVYFCGTTAKLWRFFDLKHALNMEIVNIMLADFRFRFQRPSYGLLLDFLTAFLCSIWTWLRSQPQCRAQRHKAFMNTLRKVPNLISMVSTIFFQAWNMSAITENNSSDKSEFYQRGSSKHIRRLCF